MFSLYSLHFWVVGRHALQAKARRDLVSLISTFKTHLTSALVPRVRHLLPPTLPSWIIHEPRDDFKRAQTEIGRPWRRGGHK